MSKLDDIGLISNENGDYWGSKRRYPTKEAFAEAVRREDGDEVETGAITETYMRRGRVTDSQYDIMWRICKGPARGVTPVWARVI